MWILKCRNILREYERAVVLSFGRLLPHDKGPGDRSHSVADGHNGPRKRVVMGGPPQLRPSAAKWSWTTCCHPEESAEHAAALFVTTCRAERLDPRGIVLHADNGGPMKGATMVSTLERLGVLGSFSRPRVSDDNPYSEALFRTLKYSPAYPSSPFADLAAARAWVETFVGWYNTQHLHSAIQFGTPADRHAGRDVALLVARGYARARRRTPARWSGPTRDWSPVAAVHLNPEPEDVAPPMCVGIRTMRHLS